jgi:hypothetical protein
VAVMNVGKAVPTFVAAIVLLELGFGRMPGGSA